MGISWLLAIPFLASLAAVVFLSKLVTTSKRPKKNYPPGPKPWPVIGNLHLIDSQPHRSLQPLYKKYGEIMLLRFGSKPVVVASTAEAAKEFLKIHDCSFSSRPPNAAGKYIGYNYSDVAWASYGPRWRQARKIYLTELLSQKSLAKFEYIRVEERRALMSRFHALPGKTIVLREHLFRYTLTIITRAVLGKTYFSIDGSSDEDSATVTFKKLSWMLDKWFELSGVVNIGDWIPWLNVFDLQGHVKQMKELFIDFEKLLNLIVDDHEARREAENKDFVPRDMVDILLNLAEDPNLEVKIDRHDLKALILDLLLGGTDTSATAVEFAVMALLKHPHYIKQVTEELDRVVGRDRWVEEDDFPKLTFLEAIIKETFRCYPLCTLLPPRMSHEDCKVAGYDIDKGTTLIVNAWSIGRNPKYWDSPEDFLPERFLGKEIDIKGQNFELLALGSGRRRCAGYDLGLKAVRTMLSNLLHGFNLKLPDGKKPEDVCMDEVYGLTAHPKVPTKLILEPRLHKDLYT